MKAGNIKDHLTLTAMLEDAVSRHPNKVFLRMTEGDLTYRETAERIELMAGGLASIGVREGDAVALLMNNSLDEVVTWFALARIGALHAPVNTSLMGERLRHVLTTADAKALVVDQGLAESVAELMSELPNISTVVVRPDTDGSTEWPSTVRVYEFARLESSGVLVAPATCDDLSPATLLFTSGTTGVSKACVLSHRYLARQGQIHARQFGFRPDDVLYSPFPLFHIDAATLTVVAALSTGCIAAISRRFSASGFWDEVRHFDASVFNFMGATLTILWKREPSPNDRNHRLRLGWGVPIPDWKDGWIERFGTPLLQVYGSTDAGVSVYDPIDGSQRIGACGRVVDEYELRIASVPGEIGEILVRGREPGITMSGYYSMPVATAQTIDPQGWIHTGDLGSIDKDGFVAFHGRLSDSIRRRGENISAFEVEQLVFSHPDILEVAAVGVPSELTEEDVKICVVLRPGSTLTPVELYEFCRSRAPKFMIPRYIELRAFLPKTPTQKVEKFKLRTLGEGMSVWDSESPTTISNG